MQPRVLQPIYLLLALVLALGATVAQAQEEVPVLEPVGVSGYQGDEGQGLRLSFKRLKPNPALGLWTEEEAREVVEALEEEFQQRGRGLKEKPNPATMLALTGMLPAEARPSALESRVREEYEEVLGPAQVELPGTLESARWFQALKLSPRYMGKGVREAALELFSSRAVLLSVGMSMMLYALARAAPEPVFSKALAGAVTVGLLLTYSAAELYNVGHACLRLYQEAEAARTREELEAVAERFGKALGGVGLRVLVTVAGAKLARGLPEVPKGGLWASLSPPRFAMAGGGARGSVIFKKAGMSLEDPANIVYLRDHKGPHPEAYHSEIFERLSNAVRTCRSQAECRTKLVSALDRIAGDVCTPGSQLNKLATRKP
ncbi:AHH domain-containing protein [Archangium lansingense]|uniref:AHH domain-containing protein n=1 Tax=Archangium lansingense TaxID=2995310 RepID=A0ABT3ZW54_9BACT|nr:AHH domain-containing protein [Archangium lansinium]MCY1073625.1 AHH domain-containing protein [Archangium lansinium]